MTILSLTNNNPLIDGRQSDKAMLVRRGVQVLLHEMRHSVLPELPLASGRRADLISLSAKGEIWIIEIKSSIEDFRVDRKWPEYRLHCDRLFCHPSGSAGRNLSGRMWAYPVGWLWRPYASRCAGA